MNQLEYKGFDGHIVLYCKNHYNHSNNMLEDLKKIWAIRCGYPYRENDNSMVVNIINSLYIIVLPTITDNRHFQEQLHDHLLKYLYNKFTIADNMLLFYMGKISNIQIKDKLPNNKWITLVTLPKPNKRVFNRILRGNGRYDDYKLLT